MLHGADDHRKIELETPMYDALYAWCPEPHCVSERGIERPEEDRRPLRSYVRYFLGLGTWGFGGPIASVGLHAAQSGREARLAHRTRLPERRGARTDHARAARGAGRDNAQVKAFVRGAAAAAAGAIAGATVVLSKGAIIDWKTSVIAVAALGFVLKFENREPILIACAAVAGVLFHHV
jgi:hypothetical protein